ncbi:dihydrofolate reductase family protein [Brevibacterium sp. FAM 25378]|uniref:dihydrofolate reductase family protein n=1 Tax=unclassified Brevibacterium TaxID=2614124 RepID=UPI0010919CE3|nr:dihydrofolate reductase family protein [Brevibacterium sp. S22]TGD31440.1 deaminase [Brevibacterium sp. S22]
MGELMYSINVTVDGCCDHRVGLISEELHRHHAHNLARADGLIFGRTTYEMMEDAWRRPDGDTTPPEDLDPFVAAIDPARKYLVSSTRKTAEWNTEIIRGDLASAIRRLKEESETGLIVGGVTLPRGLAELGLIDVYEFVVHPIIAGHGPYVFAGLAEVVDLVPDGRGELPSGHAVLRFRPMR